MKIFQLLANITVLLLLSSPALAEQFVYETTCEPTESEDVARVIRGHIWLALRADKTVQSAKISIKIRTADPVRRWITETELLQGLGFSFNPTTLGLSFAGNAVGHACFLDANLLVDIKVTRKNGAVQVNKFSAPLRVPGAYATQGKYIQGE